MIKRSVFHCVNIRTVLLPPQKISASEKTFAFLKNLKYPKKVLTPDTATLYELSPTLGN